MRMQKLDIASVEVTIASIYGNCDDADETRLLRKQAMSFTHGDEGFQVIGAAWNASVEEVNRWVEEDGPGWAFVFPTENTCFTWGGR